MLKLNELKAGDIVMVDFEGQKRIGDIIDISTGDKKAKVAHGENEFWYDFHDLFAVPLDEEQLLELGFKKVNGEGAQALYERGPFSLRFVESGPDRHADLHYRDETRHVHSLHFVHQLQNHYKGMTNFELSWP